MSSSYSFEVGTYAASLISGSDADSGQHPVAILYCRAAEKDGGEAYLRFYRGEGELPPNNCTERPGTGPLMMVHFHEEEYAPSIDLLRHEKPMFVTFTVRSGRAYLATGDEPVGEGPMDADRS